MRSAKNSGFTIIGTLCAIAVMLFLSSYIACSLVDAHNPDFYTKRDSRELRVWLGERMAMADAAGATFSVTYYTDKLRLVWTSGPYYAKDEYYRPDKCKLYCATKGECVYSGQWHTMTPAATYTLSYKTGSKSASQKVTVSGQGYLH